MVSPAQIRASREYEENNRDKTNVQAYHRTARMFIKNYASIPDIKELEHLIAARREFLEKRNRHE